MSNPRLNSNMEPVQTVYSVKIMNKKYVEVLQRKEK